MTASGSSGAAKTARNPFSRSSLQPTPSMDPNLFSVDWPRLFEALSVLVLLSIIVERALSVVFESKYFLDLIKSKAAPGWKMSREIIATGVSIATCAFWHFDLVSIVLVADQSSWAGYVITGAVIAGGSKGSIKLFREFLGFKSGAYKEYEEQQKLRKANLPAPEVKT